MESKLTLFLSVLPIKIKSLALILLSIIYTTRKKTNRLNMLRMKQRNHLYFHWQKIINFNFKNKQGQLFVLKIKIKFVLEILTSWFVIHQKKLKKIIAVHKLIMHTSIKIMNMYNVDNNIVDSMGIIPVDFQQKNGKHGRYRWNNEQKI